jgi:hypothetical protein
MPGPRLGRTGSTFGLFPQFRQLRTYALRRIVHLSKQDCNFSHVFHNVFVDLYYLQMIILVLDDYWWPRVATAGRYFETNLGWRPHAVRRHAGSAAVALSTGGAGLQGVDAVLARSMMTDRSRSASGRKT